ncbi:hypothetical protein PsYK624_142530 [Phanerochaete sordida]|uniref:Glycosyl transferase family 25 domain-containing protein n=1 Tax=Phanerochaete sordida TaxID=48140 RepID=A0A9P3GN34_9APHY|nr:hypothetical protein PsYK624_142530 [Phanerochaete sordida]
MFSTTSLGLGMSAATLELLGDAFSVIQTSLGDGHGNPSDSEPTRVPMPGLQRTMPSKAVSAAVAENTVLPMFSDVFVVSLPSRADRRADMERIRQAVPLFNFSFFDATPADDRRISVIYDTVKQTRETYTTSSSTAPTFLWPEDASALSHSPLGQAGADRWATAALATETAALSTSTQTASYDTHLDPFPRAEPLTCASQNYVSGPPYSLALPPYQLLTRSKLACWHSHVAVLRAIAERDDGTDKVALILEDDIDVERDVEERLQSLWGELPEQWDMLFLGHCWSNESYHAALPHAHTSNKASSLHPSRAPKCTHAYAVTRAGARRLVEHLRYVPFAYSRALDQAYAWLVLSGRVRSYSVVPSLVVQRKVLSSDIDPGESGVGSHWRESLREGVF